VDHVGAGQTTGVGDTGEAVYEARA